MVVRLRARVVVVALSENEIGVQEVREAVAHNALHQLLARLTARRGHHRANREAAQRIMDGQRALSAVLASGEGQGVRAALALCVEVDAAHLVAQLVDQPRNHRRVRPEQRQLPRQTHTSTNTSRG